VARKIPSFKSAKTKVAHIRNQATKKINVDIFFNPEKYMVRLPIDKVVADTKVYRKGVERYKQKILNGEHLAPIIVVKHPSKDLYAVLDGHHRYYAYLETGEKEICCALAGDYPSIVFYLTENGYFQPHQEITKYIRAPALQLNKDLQKFLSDFLEEPKKLEKMLKSYVERIRATLSGA